MPKSTEQVALLTEAVELLAAAGKPRHAEAVQEALAKITDSKASEDNPTLPLWMYRDTWKAAQTYCEKRGQSVSDVIDEGFKALLAGRFKPKKAPRATGGAKKGPFTARATSERTQQVTDYVTAHAEELGWTPSPSQVAAAWLEHKHGERRHT
ncbi:hypothetical protein AB0958_18530 [Streptomyces sp. NPDC006655]|uniref:hypothetical protein n=1 Tax=Streptomyces sp. NPDC006655 TaxID=3156898 RepID=UPI003454523C